MGKKFRSKKRTFRIIKPFLVVFIFITTFYCAVFFCLKNMIIDLNNEKIIKMILNIDNKSLSLNKLKSPEFLIRYTLGSPLEKEVLVLKEENQKKETDLEPIIYLYNTHPGEKYNYQSFELFNINPTVITAAYILKEYLKEHNILAIVEQRSVNDILKANKWSYGYSYRASRILLEEAAAKNETIKYFFDIHRDSSPKEKTTFNWDKKDYAKILFVVGKEHENYEKNLEFAKKINNELKNTNTEFSRGIMTKEGSGVNGIYNQNFSEQAILIEIGGQYNTIEEINNTIIYLAKAIAKVVE